MILVVPSNAYDNVYCTIIAQSLTSYTPSVPQYMTRLKICNFDLTYFDHIFLIIYKDK
jgi:hypothetical protein